MKPRNVRKALRRMTLRAIRSARRPIADVSEHAKKRIVRRMGTGTDPYIIANRAWDKKERPLTHWKFPKIPKHLYYKYGNCVFVFVPTRRGTGHTCTTIFGPFRPDGTWWEDDVLRRVN